MYIKFDKFKRARKPNIILCNPNEDELFVLSENTISNRRLALRFNTISEFTFTAQETYSDGKPCGFYDYLKTTRLIKIQGIGTFSITRVVEVDNGIYKSKDVECKTIEYEIANRSFTIGEGTYKLYDTINPEKTILGIVMGELPDWSIGSVDSDLWNLYRTFEVVETNVYDFMVSNIEEAYECIFIFDSIKRTISVKSVKNAVKPSDIFLSHKNLVKETTITEDSSEVKTALSIYGADDFSIRSVNPLGGTTIYDFSYYKNTEWMTQELIDVIDKWERKCNSASTQHGSNLKRLKESKKELLALEVKLKEQEGELKTLNNVKAVRLEQNLDITEVNSRIASKEAEIKKTKSQIEYTKKNIKNITNAISQTANNLSLENNFTKEQYKALVRFIKVGTYQNEAFGVTDSMTDVEVQEIAEELLELGKEVLGRVSKPKLSFELDAVNFLNLVGYEKFSKELELGTEILYETRDKNRFAYPVLLEMEIDYDNNTDITLSFGNRLRLDKSEYTFSELFKDTINTVGDVNFNKGKWGEGVKAKNQFNDYLNSSLNASLQEIINSNNQDILIDSSGIKCRRYNIETDSYDPEQIWITGKSIVFTDDGFQTAKTAIGNIMLPDGTRAYGINAEVILGKLIAGSQMQIMNENMSFVVDEKGVTLKNANIIVTDDSGEEVDLQNKVSSDLANAVDQIISDMGDLEEAIVDGMIDIFYQSTKPTEAKEGDLWFDTGLVDGMPKNEAYIYKKDEWVSIKDKGVIDALDKAQSAQTTADGKITSYYCIKDKLPSEPSEGDLWFDIANKNKPYVYRNEEWVSIQDGTIADAQSTANSALGKIETVTDSNGNLLTGALAGSILAGKNNIICESSSTSNRVMMNEKGIVFANSRDAGGKWEWKTAISAQGIEAEAIRSNGTLSGVNISGGTLNIGKGAFKVASTGDLTIAKASIDIGNGNFKVDSSGNITAKSMTLTGSSISDSTLTGGSLNIGNGNFKVDKQGNCTLAGDIKMTGKIIWGASSSPVKAQYSIDGYSNWHTTVTRSDKFVKYSYDGGNTWTNAIKIVGENGTNGTNGADGKDGKDGKDGLDAKLPEFITSTYIDASRVESPIFRGGLIEGCTLRARGTSKSAIEVYNSSGIRAGYIKYDDNGNGNTEGANRMFICTEHGYNMKLQSSQNMSLSASNIYLQGKVVIKGGKVTDENGQPIFGNQNATFG